MEVGDSEGTDIDGTLDVGVEVVGNIEGVLGLTGESDGDPFNVGEDDPDSEGEVLY